MENVERIINSLHAYNAKLTTAPPPPYTNIVYSGSLRESYIITSKAEFKKIVKYVAVGVIAIAASYLIYEIYQDNK